MDFDIVSFTNRLFQLIHENRNFPYMRDETLDRSKHPRRSPLHLRKAVAENTIRIDGANISSFEIGNSTLERTHPYYHILQQAPTIRKRGRGTKKTKGSQMFVNDVGQRDYEQVKWNGKTFSKEYSRNVRGARKSKKAMYVDENGDIQHKKSNSYVNVHYRYLDKIADDVAPIIANEFGLKKMRTQSSGLGDEFVSGDNITRLDDVVDILNTFM